MKPAKKRPTSRAPLLLVLATFAAAGCAHRHILVQRPPASTPAPTTSSHPLERQAPAIPPTRAELAPLVPGQYFEEGLASWYGIPFHGRRTSNGETYDMYQFTAAHRTLPFDAMVRVTNLRNGKQTQVRINDRGPFVANRIIDLSLAAARAIDLVAAGTAPVRLELVSATTPLEGFFAVQVGAFQVQENAERLRERLAARYSPVTIQEYDSPNGLFYRVRVGRAPNEDAANQLARQLRDEEQVETFVVRLDE